MRRSTPTPPPPSDGSIYRTPLRRRLARTCGAGRSTPREPEARPLAAPAAARARANRRVVWWRSVRQQPPLPRLHYLPRDGHDGVGDNGPGERRGEWLGGQTDHVCGLGSLRGLRLLRRDDDRALRIRCRDARQVRLLRRRQHVHLLGQGTRHLARPLLALPALVDASCLQFAAHVGEAVPRSSIERVLPYDLIRSAYLSAYEAGGLLQLDLGLEDPGTPTPIAAGGD